ncbi:MAG: glycosyltransferase [Patescibacteria group bacterium]
MRIAFVVGIFPAASETFIINQIVDLRERGVDVEVFAFQRGSGEGISDRARGITAHYLDMPSNKFLRILKAIPKLIRLLRYPKILRRLSVLHNRFIFQAEPFAGKTFDLVHCHFGTIATGYLIIKDIVGITAPIVTTFYGYDASKIFQEQPADVYDRLIRESSYFLAMSQNMKERMVAHGFPADRVRVLPVSIDVDSYPFARREPAGKPHILSVGRFVEKKGFDDLFRALAIVKKKIDFTCTIVGGGPLEMELKKLVDDLGLHDSIDFRGYIKIEEIIQFMLTAHLFVQPSKTAKNGDME